MTLTLTHTQLERLQDAMMKGLFRAFVEWPISSPANTLTGFPTSCYYGESHVLMDYQLSYTTTTKMTVTKQVQKAEIKTHRIYDESSIALNDFFFSPAEAIGRKRDRHENKLKQRIQLIGGMALSSVTENATFKGYVRTQTAPNRLYQVKGSDIRQVVEETVVLSDDIQTAFKQAFYTLWFHFPDAVTDIDAHLLKLALLGIDALEEV